MRFFIFVLLLTSASFSQAKNNSNTLKIKNAHKMTDRVYRGSEPKKRVTALADQGFTDVLIFKNQRGTEVEDEKTALKLAKFEPSRIQDIPMPWEKITDFAAVCRDVIKAARIVQNVEDSTDRKIFFHCTAGQDRTGLLAGIFRLLNSSESDPWNIRRAFKEEMCAHGYGLGKHMKPASVAKTVYENLNPVFGAVAKAVEQGVITKNNFDENICDSLEYKMEYIQEYQCR